jgi:isopenicillin N synthase-like dioxygenase
LARYIAIGLGKDREFFDPWFVRDSLATYRSIFYLPRAESTVKSDQLSEESLKLTTPEHSDSGFLTILSTFGFPGLQVLFDGEYRSVVPMKNHLVVNLGDTLSRVTNFRLKATKHRVLDIGIARYSNPFFLSPKYGTVIPSNILWSEEE